MNDARMKEMVDLIVEREEAMNEDMFLYIVDNDLYEDFWAFASKTMVLKFADDFDLEKYKAESIKIAQKIRAERKNDEMD